MAEATLEVFTEPPKSATKVEKAPRVTISKAEISSILKRKVELESRKEPWLDQYQLLGEFIHQRKQKFNEDFTQGEFLNRELFDSKGPKSAKISASSILGNLWPQSVKKFRINRSRKVSDNDENKKYFEFVTETVRAVLDNPKAGLITALNEYMLDEVVFGTAGIEIFPARDTKLGYRAWSVKQMLIDEGKNGFVDTIYLVQELPVNRVVGEYGIQNVSKAVREKFEEGKFDEEVIILIAIEPRNIRSPGAKGNKALPFRSVHIEVSERKAIRESGFSEIPIKVGRFSKIIDEKYGRSPGMDALPDIMESNAIWEAVTIAIEKNLDPPLGLVHDLKTLLG